MKTDTDDSIRVTITLNRESNPEWFVVLKNIRSGRARAEIVRKHLATPRVEGRFQALATQSAEIKRDPVGTEAPASLSDVYPEGGKVNSSAIPSGAASHDEDKAATANNAEVQNKAGVNDDRASEKPSRGGLASVLLKNGRSGISDD